MRDELQRRLAGRFRTGPVVDAHGRQLGTHDGLPFYTVGQRSGLGIRADRPDAAPLYVLELRPHDNTVVVGERDQLHRREAHAADCSWTGARPRAGLRCSAQLRAHARPQDIEVIAVDSDTVSLRFEEAAQQVSPGQSVVLYRDDEVLGGGVIAAAG
ncbi:MAG: aminomethyltransferase beta-barrel domain-containing protein, partial [Candidatus Dormibacteria bacterium]